MSRPPCVRMSPLAVPSAISCPSSMMPMRSQRLGRLLHVVRRVEHRDAEPPDGLEDGVAALRVDADGGLVEDEQLGPVQQTGRHVGPPLHAARIGPDAVLPAVGQSDQLERVTDAALQFLAAQPVELSEEGQVLHRREVRVEGQVLRHVAHRRLRLERAACETVDRDVSLVGRDEPAQHGDGRGLPGTVGPQQSVALALGDGEGHALHRLAVAVALAQAGAVQHRGCSRRRRHLVSRPGRVGTSAPPRRGSPCGRPPAGSRRRWRHRGRSRTARDTPSSPPGYSAASVASSKGSVRPNSMAKVSPDCPRPAMTAVGTSTHGRADAAPGDAVLVERRSPVRSALSSRRGR